MIKSNGGVFGRNPTFNDVTVDGNLTVNGDIALGDDIVVADSLTVQGTTASTSTTTGALRVTGGVGIGGALYTGADAVINGARVGIGPAGTDNTVLGVSAGAALQAGGNQNVAIGRSSLASVTTGDANVSIGFEAAQLTTASSNIALGYQALKNNVNAEANVAIGFQALLAHAPSSAATRNNAIGTVALAANVAGVSNSVMGYAACRFGASGSHIVAVGDSAATRNTANDIVAIGSASLSANTLGTANVAVGRSALGAATTSIGTFTTTPVAAGSGYTANQTGVTVTLVKKSGADTFTGTVQAALTTNASGAVTAVAATPVSAGATFTGSNVIFEPSGFGAGSGCEISIATLATAASNTAVGHQAGLSLTTGTQCTIVGSQAGDAITTGSSNVIVGHTAAGSLTTNNFVTVVGQSALASATNGAENATAIGFQSLIHATSAADCVTLGFRAGRFITDGSNCTAATDTILIGSDARPAANTQSNQIVIGHAGRGDGSNTTVIGNTSTTSTRFAGTATSVLRTSGDTLRIDNDRTPATAGAAGNEGDICWDANYIYVCVAANTWKRVAIATWP